MGFSPNNLRALLWLRQGGASFDRVACLGRQKVHAGPANIADAFRDFGIVDETVTKFADCYAEEMLHFLGAKEVHSFDASDYEGASDIHDFNLPLEGKYRNHFDLVVDGGTLEHIFNVPTAFANAMSMVRAGGLYLGLSPTNNFCGHGLYQFSPEFYFRVFSSDNGFQLEHMFAYEAIEAAPWFRVVDPKVIGERVLLSNSLPTILIIVARKLESKERYFTIHPQQSDYAAAWTLESVTPQPHPESHTDCGDSSRIRAVVRGLVPRPLLFYYRKVRDRRAAQRLKREREAIKLQSPMHRLPRFFTPFDPRIR